MAVVENTTFAAIENDCCFDSVGYELRDVHGRPVRKGEEYYLLGEDDSIVLVHIEDAANYLKDERLRFKDHDELMKLMDLHYDAYPQIM